MGKSILPPQFSDRSVNIHVLGVGNVGKLVAHALRANHPTTRVTLMYQSSETCKKLEIAQNALEIQRNGQWHRQEFFESRVSDRSGQHIRNLVVATKCHHTLDAMRAIRFRLNKFTNVCFLQNGGGIMEEISELYIRNAQRPSFSAGIVTHGVTGTKESPFSATHVGMGEIMLGSLYPKKTMKTIGPQNVKPRTLGNFLAKCPELNVKLVSPQQIFIAQLRKIAVNSVINPLTTLFSCKNGELFGDDGVEKLMKKLIQESSAIVLAVAKQRVVDDDGAADDQLSAASVQEAVWDIGAKTAENTSSMLQDKLAAKSTEIDYLNGYLVEQADRMKVTRDLNAALVKLVKLRVDLSIKDALPLLNDLSTMVEEIEVSVLQSRGQNAWVPVSPPSRENETGMLHLQAKVREAVSKKIAGKAVKKEGKSDRSRLSVNKIKGPDTYSVPETVKRMREFRRNNDAARLREMAGYKEKRRPLVRWSAGTAPR